MFFMRFSIIVNNARGAEQEFVLLSYNVAMLVTQLIGTMPIFHIPLTRCRLIT